MDITSISGILPTYPSWVRTLMFGTALVWIVIYLVLLFKAPPDKKTLQLVKFERVYNADTQADLVLAISLVNNTGKTVPIKSALLTFYEDERSYSGLQSSSAISTRYKVYLQNDQLVSGNGDGLVKPVESELKVPYAGQAQMNITISIDQILEDKKGDRFLIEFPDASVIMDDINLVDIELQYGEDDVVSESVTLK